MLLKTKVNIATRFIIVEFDFFFKNARGVIAFTSVIIKLRGFY